MKVQQPRELTSLLTQQQLNLSSVKPLNASLSEAVKQNQDNGKDEYYFQTNGKDYVAFGSDFDLEQMANSTFEGNEIKFVQHEEEGLKGHQKAVIATNAGISFALAGAHGFIVGSEKAAAAKLLNAIHQSSPTMQMAKSWGLNYITQPRFTVPSPALHAVKYGLVGAAVATGLTIGAIAIMNQIQK